MLLAIYIRYVTLPLGNLYQSKLKLQKTHSYTTLQKGLSLNIRTNTLLSQSYWQHTQHICIYSISMLLTSSCYSLISTYTLNTYWPTFYLFVICALLFARCVFVCHSVSDVGVVVALAKLLLSLLYMLLINFTMRYTATRDCKYYIYLVWLLFLLAAEEIHLVAKRPNK